MSLAEEGELATECKTRSEHGVSGSTRTPLLALRTGTLTMTAFD